MRFEAEYTLKNYRQIEGEYFNELGECWNRHVLSKDFAEQTKKVIDNLENEILYLEEGIKKILENSPDELKTVIEAYFKQELNSILSDD